MVQKFWKYGRGALITLSLAAAFAYMGVFDQGNTPFWQAFPVWLMTMSVGAVSSIWIAPAIFRHSPCSLWPLWLQIPVAALLIAVPVTAALILVDAADGTSLPVRFWPQIFSSVFFLSIFMTVGAWLLHRHDALKEHEEAGELTGPMPVSATDEPAEKAVATFMKRLPMQMRHAQLYGISSEDHYLRVHTGAGEELILMRLADAVDMLPHSAGLKVHRSWWIAHDGVERVENDGGKPFLILKSGAKAPVARSAKAAAKEAGLL